MACGTAAVVWVGGLRVLEGQLTVGDILVFLAYLGMLYSPMKAFSEGSGVAQSARTQLARVFRILDTRPEVADPPHAIVPPRVDGRVEFDNVEFEYDSGRPVLRNIQLTIEPGRVLALVGSTGAGKSTLASLALRLYDPQGGAVRLDGRDLRELPLSWLRRQVSIVLQDAILFSTSIAENIAYGRPEASREEIVAAARLARADDFIRALPDGYDTPLNERGRNLSHGQRQLLAFARVLAMNPEVLVLDEATASIDTETELVIQAALRELTHGRTSIIIAHRLQTIKDAHRIVVLSEGKVREIGTHEELIARGGMYNTLYELQFQEVNAG
jgi:ABC-type multidrug transport system fused ATPase/permease subunit